MSLSDKARALILEHEGFVARPSFPGGQSGVTIGIGYDLGYATRQSFRADWQDYLPSTWLDRLTKAIGVTGAKAKDLLPSFMDIRITPHAAIVVFEKKTLPRYLNMCRAAFEGFSLLPADAQGALVSLVFNRGTRMTDKSPAIEERREMRAIHAAIAGLASSMFSLDDTLREIAAELRSMKRLWDGSLPPPYDAKMGGLVRRREDEALLVESCIS